MHGPQELAWATRLELELPNMRAALSGLLEQENADRALELLRLLWPLWLRRGYFREGTGWCRRASVRDPDGVWPREGY